METDKLNHIISSKNESPFKSIKEDKNKDYVEIIPEDTFAGIDCLI